MEFYKERTEMTLPYTVTQVEDSMYLNQQYIVTLEYHYYQNDCVYNTLEKHNIDDQDIFGIENFKK